VTLIGADVAKKLFADRDALGREVMIDGRPFHIVGVAKPMGTMLGQSQDGFAYIPIQTYFKIYGQQQSLSVNVQARSATWMERTQEEVRALDRKSTRLNSSH